MIIKHIKSLKLYIELSLRIECYNTFKYLVVLVRVRKFNLLFAIVDSHYQNQYKCKHNWELLFIHLIYTEYRRRKDFSKDLSRRTEEINLEAYWNLKWMKLVMQTAKMAARSDERNVIIGDQI